MATHYYVYQGFCDGSGCPGGYIIKQYTDKEAQKLINHGIALQKLENNYDNTDYIWDHLHHYNPAYIKRQPISEGTFWGVPHEALRQIPGNPFNILKEA